MNLRRILEPPRQNLRDIVAALETFNPPGLAPKRIGRLEARVANAVTNVHDKVVGFQVHVVLHDFLT